MALRCEYAADPLGVDVPRPRFSWLLESSQRGQMQCAYQVLVAGSEEDLQAGIGSRWDSGKVASDQSVNVAYQGSPLTSGEVCWWTVRAWDVDGMASAYGAPARFEMGQLHPHDWEGEWIGGDRAISAPLLRKAFEVPGEIARARAYVSGLGWYELYLNGNKVGDRVLGPATTDYARRVLYATYDVTDLLRAGPNAVGVMLGNGWFCEPGWDRPYGDSPRLLFQLNVECADGSEMRLASDGTWKVAAGPITSNDDGGPPCPIRVCVYLTGIRPEDARAYAVYVEQAG